jgi:hypothetical protein
MPHSVSADDLRFRRDFEAGLIAPSEFSHRAHVRLAYAYLCDGDTDAAHVNLRGALTAFIARHGIDPAKYHETLTRAWVLAVRHFMDRSPDTRSAEEFMARSERLFEKDVMLTHYTREALFSEAARREFVDPNLSPIPATATPH